ncbi:MAG: hypothetical protein ABEK12_00995, partial [Candidatus Nanohaloarchaea archaeon]
RVAGTWWYETSKGVQVLRRPYPASAIVQERALRQDDASRILAPDLHADDRPVAADIGERWNLERRPYPENYNFLQMRVKDTARYAHYSQNLQHYDLFGYTPLIEYSMRLPVAQRQNRRILRRIADGMVPDRIITKGASGYGFLVAQFRRAMAADRDRYGQLIDRFLDRGYLDGDAARRVLLPDSIADASKGPASQMAATMLLEQWMETFIDRDEPWTRPG